MKLEKLAALSEIISSIAIVVTLIYLAVQTNQMSSQTEQMAFQSERMTDAILATSRQEIMAADIANINSNIATPEAWFNIDRPYAELSDLEKSQIRNVYAGVFRVREYAWFQYKNGILDEATMRSYLAPMPRWIGRTSGGELWAFHSQEMDPEFVDYVNKLVMEYGQKLKN